MPSAPQNKIITPINHHTSSEEEASVGIIQSIENPNRTKLKVGRILSLLELG
jgi:hypothetical protein